MKTTKTTITTAKELANLFPTLHKWGLLKNATTSARRKYATERGALRNLQNQEQDLADMFARPKVKQIYLEIEWSTGGAYGWQSYCDFGRVTFEDGTSRQIESSHKTTGCGYDKLSTTVAGCLNECLKPLLLQNRRRYLLAKNKGRAPYGADFGTRGWMPYFDGGVGVSSTIQVLKFLGAKVEHESHKKSDYFTITF